jgi:predicted dehydrogenase
MRFALLGTHPDGIDMACALVETGRHELVAYTSAEPVPDHIVRRWGPQARRLHDLEDLLADPAVEAVIVAGSPANRTVQLRRALQSERHVLCVYPPDAAPDGAYEAAMIREDTGRVLLPLMPEALHPGVVRLAEVVRSGTRPLVEPRLIEVERWATDTVLLDDDVAGHRPAFPGWDVLRALGGEVVEVSALAPREELTTEEPVLLTGRFERGLLFQWALLPYQSEPRWRVVAVGSHGRAELLFPVGGRGPAFLSWGESDGALHEEVGFKGTMTLVGCGLIWLTILIVILANWFPQAGWAVVPLLVVFLGLQAFRWIVPRSRPPAP